MKIGFRTLLVASLAVSGCGPVAHPAGYDRRVPMAAGAPAKSPDAPVLKRLEKGGYYVRKPWTVELDGHRWVIPRGYHSNGITAPARMKHSLGDGVDFPETWAAIFHDWLFTQPGVTRTQADKWFHDLLLAYHVPRDKAAVMFATVSAYSFSKNFR